MAYQAALTNHTPFAADKFVLMDRDGQEVVLVVLAATFDLTPGREPAPVEEPGEPFVEDKYAGDPTKSSLLYESELALVKPLVDVVVNATAYAPRGRPVDRVPVEVRVGDIKKALWVTGYRVWGGLRGTSKAIPFADMPIRYERAFGGSKPDGSEMFAENPVGVGFNGAMSDDALKAQIPNVEYADSMMNSRSDIIRPAGFGPIARWWAPRPKLAGTFDAAHMESRWPLLPTNFDDRFNQVAPADQRSATIVGGEACRLTNLTPDGVWEFHLPRLHVPVHLVFDRTYHEARLRLDTVAIDPELRRVRLTARYCLNLVRGANALREIALGPVSRGWLRSVHTRKRYLDGAGTGGGDRSVPCYST